MKKQSYNSPKKSDTKPRSNNNGKKGNFVPNKGGYKKPQAPLPKLPLVYVDSMTVADISAVTKRTVADIIKALMELGFLASQNQSIDRDTAELLADALHIEFKIDESKDLTNFEKIKIEDKEEDLVLRSPVVTIMGHVDHGKTTLLDTIRNSRVVATEFGGITQEIGAYVVNRNGKSITFIDTPGHAAFTEMRARGAQVTDIVVLVVAADDGVMPQTKEAIDHAQASKCPMIVAINKCDRPNANPDRVKQELAEYNVLPEDWGGTTPFINISALRGTNVDELLDTIQLVAEVEEYKANPNREGTGYVIESKLDKSKGPQATLLVKNGTLRIGDVIVCGDTWAKIRAMYNDLGKQVREAGPSEPVSVFGLADVPVAGDQFLVVKDERQARTISETRSARTKAKSTEATKMISLEDIFNDQEGDTKELKLIVKSDTSGTAEAVKGSIEKIDVEGIKVSIVRASVGPVTENDVLLAQASLAIIVAFNVQTLANVKDFAKSRGIEVRSYNIIYKLIEDIEAAMKGMLSPVYEDKVCGQAEVRETYKISKLGTVAGCMVTDGFVRKTAQVELSRDGVILYTGRLASLKRFKDDAREVKAGYDCGIMIENFNDIKVGDILTFTITEEVKNEE
ncbi:MAG: translation initiation factor IF-2 [Gammaproteobacteria bacterium]|nr:translation initiation factor IF-2 [Gammaproteobacteria bacterium]